VIALQGVAAKVAEGNAEGNTGALTPRILRMVSGVAVLVVGCVLGLFGAFTLLYGGEEGSTGDSASVSIGGRFYDANLAGGVALALGASLITIAVLVLRRR
jgi:hypothetical protein